MPSFSPVIALSRGLEILRVVNDERKATVRSLHQATGLDKATIVRMLETLEHEGYVMREVDAPVYSPTGRTLMLSQGYDRHLWIGAMAEPILQNYRKIIGWPSDLAICDRDAMVIVETTRGQAGLSFNRQPGFRAPILVTSLGRAYLSVCPEAEREAILATLAKDPDSWSDLARDRKTLDGLLAKVRDDGFAVMDDSYSKRRLIEGMWAMAVPVRNGDAVFGSVNMMMLRNAIDLEGAKAKFLKPLQAMASEIAAALVKR